MREPNFSFPNQNRAAICITSSIYDRRALDCTDYIPIINTLTNLAYLTGSTPTIREFVARDGGLERLVTILKSTKVNDRKNGLKWTLAFQCVVNIGVRGTEHIRKRVVQAGMVPVIVNVLESFFAVLKSVSEENERKKLLRKAESAQQNSQPMITDGETAPMSDEPIQHQGADSSSNSSSSSLSSTSITAPALTSSSTTTNSVMTGLLPSTAPSTGTLREEPLVQNAAHFSHNMPESAPGLSVMPVTQEPSQPPSDDTRSIPTDAGEARQQQFFYREDDILHSLQLLAYLSKYPSLRSSFHTASGSNVFAIVEKFTHRTMHPLEIQYWAGVIMRNACRKDDARKGIRQCAYTGCGKWETRPREFAKCRRCRKAKYCSKQCQSKAWNEGHRWWCIEKKAETMGVSSSFGTDLPPAPPPPPPPADLQDQQDTGPSLMENGGISSVGAGATGARMIGGSDGGTSTGHSLSRTALLAHQQHQLHHSSPSSSSSSSSGGHRSRLPAHGPTSSAAALGLTSALPEQLQERSRHSHHQPQPEHQQQQPQQPHHSQSQQQQQQQYFERQPISLPQQYQASLPAQQQQQQQLPYQSQPQYLQFSQDPLRLQQMRLQQQQQQPQPQHRFRYAPSPLQNQHQPSNTRTPLNEESVGRRFVPMPQRSMTHPHPSTAPIVSPPRSELTPHLGILPDSPTPEQLAQRFVQQVALHPGQHNELAQQLIAQFQQYFPPHNQAEAKRQFSFHAREHFARYQRQQELLRNGGQEPRAVGNRAAPEVHSAPLTTTHASWQPSASSSGSGAAPVRGSDLNKQGTPRRRSDVDSDDDDETLVSGPHSTTSVSVPMLTQDLSTTMSLSSVEISGPLNMPASTFASSSTSQVSEGEYARSDSTTVRDYKVRKLMAPEETTTHMGSSSADIQRQGPSQPTDEWSYSRQMAKDTSTTNS
ncbi:hypothetical protein BGX28_002755 [Mortierella sp. GBA30]|nr:hypothetical protein BGX28_002755 [Mortierella sp. GBA30]